MADASFFAMFDLVVTTENVSVLLGSPVPGSLAREQAFLRVLFIFYFFYTY